MARKPKTETALVQRQVVDGELLDSSAEKDAMADALETLATQNIQLVKLLTMNYETIVQEKLQLAGIVNESLKQQVELTKMQQEALDKKHDRKIKQEREKAHAEFMREVAGDVKILLPLILNKFAKGKAIPEGELSLLRPFIEKFSDEELAFHMKHMSQSQEAAFLDMLKAIPDHGVPKPPDPKKPNGAH